MIIKTIIFILAIPSLNFICGKFVRLLNLKLKESISSEGITVKRIDLYEKPGIKLIRTIFGCTEIFLFCFFTILLLKYKTDQFEILKSLLVIISGWMTLKVVGNFKNWQNDLEGRIVYCIFVLGSILSISLGVGLGFLFYISS